MEFFKEVGVAQAAPLVQGKAQPAQKAHKLIRENREEGIFDAVNSLVKGGLAVNKLAEPTQEEKAILRSKHTYEASRDAADYTTNIALELEEYSKGLGKQTHDMSTEELQSFQDQRLNNYMTNNNHSDKPYASLIRDNIRSKNTLLLDKQLKLNYKTKQTTNLDTLGKEITSMFNSGGGLMTLDLLEERIQETVGLGRAIEMDASDVKQAMIPYIMKPALESNRIDQYDLMNTKEFKEYFKDVDSYENVVNVVRRKTMSNKNKVEGDQFNLLEEKGLTISKQGGFKSKGDVDQFFKESPFQKLPTKRIEKLKASLYKTVELEESFDDFRLAKDSGDNTYGSRRNWSLKKDKAMEDKYFSHSTGIDLSTPDALYRDILSGTKDSMLTSLGMNNIPMSPTVVESFETESINGVKGLRDQFVAYSSLKDTLSGTLSPIDASLTDKAKSRLILTGDLINKLESGIITDGEFQQAITDYKTDTSTSLTSYGGYTTELAQDSLNNGGYKELLAEDANDAPWTWDDNSTAAYKKRKLTSSYNLYIRTGKSPDRARELANESYEMSHTQYEGPDGSEIEIPNRFNRFNMSLVNEMVLDSTVLSAQRSNDKLFGSDFMFKRKVSVRPHPEYEKNGYLSIYYENELVPESHMSLKTLSDKMSVFKSKTKTNLLDKHLDRITEE